MNINESTSTRAAKTLSVEAARVSMISSRFMLLAFVFLCAVLCFVLPCNSSFGAKELNVTVKFAKGGAESGILEDMGTDGTITIRTKSGKLTYRRNQYVSATADGKPEELVAADKSLKNKEYDDAVAMYRTAYEKYKWLNLGEEALYGIGNAHRLAGRNKEALESYSEFLRVFPNSGSRFVVDYYSGSCYRQLGQYDEALKAFNDVVDATDNAYTMYALANVSEIQFQKKNYDDALRASLMLILIYENTQGSEALVQKAKQLAGKCYDELIEVEKDSERLERLKKDKSLVLR